MIQVNEPRFSGREIEYVNECLRTGWISSRGRFIDEFENKWADYCGMKYGIAVCNGTLALQLALASIKLEPGDEVILPTFTIISCALAILANGGIPVLVDCEPRTRCMDAKQIEAKITKRTRAIMPVHIYGHPVDMDPIRTLAQKNYLIIIEDAAEAHGAEYKGTRCGGLGDLSCFSFYANKIITTGEGGMVLTNNKIYADRMRSLRNLCFREDRRFYHTEIGYNFRMTNIQAALGVAQLEQIEMAIQQKRWIASFYNAQLNHVSELHLPIEEPWAKNVFWMYGIVLDKDCGLNAHTLAKRLLARGIMTRPFFLGMHEQPAFHQRGMFLNEHYPVAEFLSKQGFYLPSGLTLSEKQLNEICNAVKTELKH